MIHNPPRSVAGALGPLGFVPWSWDIQTTHEPLRDHQVFVDWWLELRASLELLGSPFKVAPRERVALY